MTTSDDDQHVFPDRSLGTIVNGAPGAVGPHQLASASGNGGSLSTQYDAAGNLTLVAITPTASPTAASAVQAMTFGYQWDELGRLSQATRVDHANGEYELDASMKFTYDAGNQRVLQSREDTTTNATLYDVDVFDSMHLTHASFPDSNGDYERDAMTESLYLRSNGTTFAHVIYTQEDEPAASAGALHAYMEFGDALGSTSFVVDHDTGELVERPTFQSYGAAESDYRPDRWGDFRERYRYTGQDDDAEVGIVYFGQRYYAPVLGRWLSPDPLTIHGLGSSFNPYQFVYGSPTALTDPDGLDPIGEESGGDTYGGYQPDGVANGLGIGNLLRALNPSGGGGAVDLPSWYWNSGKAEGTSAPIVPANAAHVTAGATPAAAGPSSPLK
jgi:RHS repeat-associated protein